MTPRIGQELGRLRLSPGVGESKAAQACDRPRGPVASMPSSPRAIRDGRYARHSFQPACGARARRMGVGRGSLSRCQGAGKWEELDGSAAGAVSNTSDGVSCVSVSLAFRRMPR